MSWAPTFSCRTCIPKAFIRKHLLSEEDEDAIRKPLQGLFEDVKKDLNGVKADLSDVAAAADPKTPLRPTPAPAIERKIDLDAT